MDFLAGAFGGVLGLFASHPIDTIKTSVQSGKLIPKNPVGLYRGVIPPLCGMFVEKAVVFGTYQTAKNNGVGTVLSGGFAGFAASVIVAPYERLKIILQNGGKLNSGHFKPNSLWRGLSATFTREVPGFAIYFKTFEVANNYYYPEGDISNLATALIGAASGSTAWLFIYPQDMIKTHMQSFNNTGDTKPTFMGTAQLIYRERGLIGFLKGFHWALLRAAPLHGGAFLGFSMANNFFNEHNLNF
jgi:solute carrier family 25 (mitochondrial carnitine/acylcarnitine transporter), member 20/29